MTKAFDPLGSHVTENNKTKDEWKPSDHSQDFFSSINLLWCTSKRKISQILKDASNKMQEQQDLQKGIGFKKKKQEEKERGSKYSPTFKEKDPEWKISTK